MNPFGSIIGGIILAIVRTHFKKKPYKPSKFVPDRKLEDFEFVKREKENPDMFSE